MNLLRLARKTRPTDEQSRTERKLAKEQKAELRALQKQQVTEAMFYAQMIPNALARLKIATITKQKNKLQINKVKIKPPVLIHEDYYMMEVNTGRLPYGVKIEHLRDPETLTTLSAACRTEVEVRFTPTEGFWYLIPRRGGLGIIPRIIPYDDVMELMPNSANIWSFPIGVTENRRLTWIDLRKTPHMMIIGSTGTGKTVFLKSLLLTLATNCSPARLRFVICDFKRGPDFKTFSELPHLGTPLPVRHTEQVVGLTEEGEMDKEKTPDYMDRILIDLDEIMQVLQWGHNEIDRRNAMFDEDITDIDRWNAKHRRHPLPHVVIIIDEVGVIMNRLSNKDQATLTIHLADIAMLGRSAGIHLVLGLQKLVRKVLDGAISDNIEARIVGLCASGAQSAMAMGNGSWAAARLPKIKGRAMWRDVDGELEVQLPWVDPKHAVQMVDAVINKWVDGQDSEDRLAMEIFQWCLETQNGDYHLERVYQHFRTQGVRQAQIKEIRLDYLIQTGDDGEPEPVFQIDGVDYVLIPHVPGVRPSRIVTKEKYDQIGQPEEPAEIIEAEPEPKHDVTLKELLLYSLEYLGGDLGYRKLYDAFKDRGITVHELKRMLRDHDNRVFELNGINYLVDPGIGQKPRTLVSHESQDKDQPAKSPEPPSEDDETNLDNWPDLTEIADDSQSENEFDELPDWLQPAAGGDDHE